MAFHDRIKELRKKHGWTQDDLGSKLEIHGRHVGKYETGNVLPNAETLIKIAKLLGVSIDYLLLDDDGPRKENIDKELIREFELASQMEEDDKLVVKKLIDAFVKKRKVEEAMA